MVRDRENINAETLQREVVRLESERERAAGVSSSDKCHIIVIIEWTLTEESLNDRARGGVIRQFGRARRHGTMTDHLLIVENDAKAGEVEIEREKESFAFKISNGWRGGSSKQLKVSLAQTLPDSEQPFAERAAFIRSRIDYKIK